MNKLMEQSILETGKKIGNTATESKPGQTTLAMKVTTSTERSTVWENSNGLTHLVILVNFTAIIYMEKESTRGQTAGFTKESGEQIRCTEKAASPGSTAGNTSESMLKTRKEVTVSLYGQTAAATEVSGSTASNMVREHTLPLLAKKSMASGKKASA
jgi:hypothetical protein